MSFDLEFRALPDSGSQLSAALVPWDSELFGFPVHELRFANEVELRSDVVAGWLSSLDCTTASLVAAKVDQRSVPLLEMLSGHRFYPVETTLELEGSLSAMDSAATTPGLPTRMRPALEADVPAMSAIAASAFWSDRFHLDPHLSDDVASLRYVRWVAQAVADGDPVFAYERTDDGTVIGFFHVRPVSNTRVDVMLVALVGMLTGRGLGKSLYQAGMRECIRMGFATVQTRVAARNLASLNTFMGLGFSARTARTVLHRYQPATVFAPADIDR